VHKKLTATDIADMKGAGRKVVALTAYDFLTARLEDEAGVDLVLVGDSVATTFVGEKNTLGVTMDQMVYHTRCVSNGVRRALVVGDMPFMSYQVSTEQAAANAGRMVAEGGAEAVKLEGGSEFADTVSAIVRCGIPVLGHVGLLPQSVHRQGGFRVQGRDVDAAEKIIADAESVVDAGAFAVGLECVVPEVAAAITNRVPVPTIGIGSGPQCDGQILVCTDMLNLRGGVSPRFVKVYGDAAALLEQAFTEFADEVREGTFPSEEHCYQ